MIYLIWLLTVLASFGLGYFIRSLVNKIEILEQTVVAKVDKPKEAPSTLIDPLDPVKEALYEHEKMMKRLNPDE